jgi:protocatechuate 3,4-dioxygenase alpha subunit
MGEEPMSLRMSASQTVGPFFELGLSWLYRADIGPEANSGERLRIRGHVYDGDGASVPDAVLEIWQADTQGRFATTPEGAVDSAAEFMGFGRVPVNADGAFEVRTLKPGRVPAHSAGQLQAPHLSITVLMRGLLMPVHTRLYFPDDPANAEDPVLRSVPEARRGTLNARAIAENTLEWDVRIQGEHETVFFSF